MRKLLQKTKWNYFKNLDKINISDSRNFSKTVKPMLPNEIRSNENKIQLRKKMFSVKLNANKVNQ